MKDSDLRNAYWLLSKEFRDHEHCEKCGRVSDSQPCDRCQLREKLKVDR